MGRSVGNIGGQVDRHVGRQHAGCPAEDCLGLLLYQGSSQGHEHFTYQLVLAAYASNCLLHAHHLMAASLSLAASWDHQIWKLRDNLWHSNHESQLC